MFQALFYVLYLYTFNNFNYVFVCLSIHCLAYPVDYQLQEEKDYVSFTRV